MSELNINEAFGQYVLKSGMATGAQVEAARNLQKEREGSDIPLSLADALVESGAITPEQRETVDAKIREQREGVKQLGPYRLKKKIGEGAMGAVYLVEHQETSERFALKILPKRQAQNESFYQRFLREADSATRLKHENIVQAFAVGEDRGFPYYVMELCEGETLRARLDREKTFPVKAALEILIPVVRGLAHAHEHGFVHRDIKPENIILMPGGGVKILDLGLTKSVGGGESAFQTVDGIAMGTPHYMAPEQARGEALLDGRADFYSVGATLYHLLTGNTPYRGTSSLEILTKHVTEKLKDPRDYRPDLPMDVVRVLRRMMAKKPEDRHPTGAALLSDLEQLVAGSAPKSAPLDAERSAVASSTRRARGPAASPDVIKIEELPDASAAKKKKLLVIGGGAAAALLVVILIVAMAGGSDEPEKVTYPLSSTASAPEPVAEPEPEPDPEPAAAAPVPKSPRELEREAQRELGEIQALEREGSLKGDALTARYEEFAKKHGSTTAGKVIADWLTARKKEGTKDPVAAAPERPAPPPPPVVRPEAPEPDPAAAPKPAAPAPKPAEAAPKPSAPAAAAPAPASVARPGVVPDSDPDPKWRGAVDLLPLIDPARDAVMGSWTRGPDGSLNSDQLGNVQVGGARIEIPYLLPEEYDFRIVFTRKMGRGDVAHILAQAGRTFAWKYEFGPMKFSGFSRVNNRDAGNPTVLRNLPRLVNGRKYTSVVEVRRDGLNVFLDGMKISEWKTDYQNMSIQRFFLLNDPTFLGVATWASPTTFHRIDLREVTGKGGPARGAVGPIPPDGLVGYWKLDGGKGRQIEDSSGVGMIGSMQGGARWDRGRFGSGVKFDRVDAFLSVPDHESLRIQGDMTLSFWMKKDAESLEWARVVGKGDFRNRNYGVFEEPGSAKRVMFQQYDGQGRSVVEVYSRATVEIGRWYHVAAVVKGARAAIYIDGQESGAATRTGTPALSFHPLRFGRAHYNGPFTGSLDEIRLYRRALSTEEIRALYLNASAVKRLPVPAAAKLAEAESLVREVFKDEIASKSRDDQRALAGRMLEEAAESKDVTSRYVLMRESREAAIRAGDPEAAFRAIESVGRYFEIDELQEKSDVLADLERNFRSSKDAGPLAEGYVRVAEEAAAAEDLDQARKLMLKAKTLARRARDSELSARIRTREKEFAELREQLEEIAPYLKTLKEKPDDPKANAAVGRYLCLTRNEWAEGLPLLAKGADAGLRAAAAKDVADPVEPKDQAAAGDDWWALADQEQDGVEKDALTSRALYWYRQALPGLAGISRLRIEKKLADAGDPAAGGGIAPAVGSARVKDAVTRGVTFLKSQIPLFQPWQVQARNMYFDELTLYAFLHAGVPYDDPDFQKLFTQMMERDLESTYPVALQAMVLYEIDRVKYQWRLQQCAQFLVDSQCGNGQWAYGTPSTAGAAVPEGDASPPKGRREDPESKRIRKRILIRQRGQGPPAGDNSNAVYAALGLRACFDAGIVIEPSVIRKAERWWKNTMIDVKPAPGKAPSGGWCYRHHPTHQPYGSMTAGGLVSLSIWGYLQDRARSGAWKRDRDFQKGFQWLAQNGSVKHHPGTHEHAAMAVNSQHMVLYYLDKVQMLGSILGEDSFGKFKWYDEGVQQLLSTQLPMGSWRGGGANERAKTCFAILFLTKATRPIPGGRR